MNKDQQSGPARLLRLSILLFGFLLLGAAPRTYRHPFQNPDLNIEKRIDNLLSLMTVEEKIRCLSTVPDVPRLGVEGTGHVEGLHGLSMGTVGGWGGGSPVPTTQFPQSYGLGATWDPDLLRLVGAAEGREVRYLWETRRRGGLVVRCPNADLGRDPRWGRTEECYGEDAFLNGALACAMTRGLQGDHPKYLQAASLLKHFLANSNENDRTKTSSDFDERLYHEYYAAPFRRAIVEGKAQGMMAAYNAVNGVPCHIHPMFKEIVIGTWKHDGILCTDGGGLGLLVRDHKAFPTIEEAAAACVTTGLNQFLDRHDKPCRTAVHKGLLKEAEIDSALRGVFRVMIRLGMLDPAEGNPYRRVGKEEPWLSREHQFLALRATQESIVLLKNDKGMLPLDPTKVRKVAVIGRYADLVIADWYGGDAPYLVSPLEGIRKRLGAAVTVLFARDNTDGAAVKLAKECDLVVFCAGNHPIGNGGWAQRDSPAEGKEAMDRDSMELRNEDLLRKVLAANRNTVAVIVGSFPFAMEWTAKNAPAILHMTHSGQESGTALAGVLFGDFNPGGKTVQTWPKSMKDLPPMLDYDIRKGRTYMYMKKEPLYPFGYGLSYTTFEYSNLSVPDRVPGGGAATVRLTLANTGAREGAEVVQLYVRWIDSKVERPLKELKAFRRVTLEAGERREIALVVHGKDLAHWDVESRGWRVEEGKAEVQVGSSSEDIRLKGNLVVSP